MVMMEMEVSCVVTVMDDGEIGSPTICTSSCSEPCGCGKCTALECSEGRRLSAKLASKVSNFRSAEVSAGVVDVVTLMRMVLLTSRAICAGCCAKDAALLAEVGCEVAMHG